MEMTQEQKLYDKFVRIREQRDYWKKRCELAEAMHKIEMRYGSIPRESARRACDDATFAYNKFISETKEP